MELNNLENFISDVVKLVEKGQNTIEKGSIFSNFLLDSDYFQDNYSSAFDIESVDKKGDGGVDISFVDCETNIACIIQCKYGESYKPSTITVETNKLLDNIIKGNSSSKIISKLNSRLNPTEPVDLTYILFTINDIKSKTELKNIDEAISKYKEKNINLNFKTISLTDIYNFNNNNNFSNVKKWYKLPRKYFHLPDYVLNNNYLCHQCLGQIPVLVFLEFFTEVIKDRGGRIINYFSKNVRVKEVSGSKVNAEIKKTLEKQPEYFNFFNLGAKNICGGLRFDDDYVWILDPNSSDGCQSINTIWGMYSLATDEERKNFEKAFITCQFVDENVALENVDKSTISNSEIDRIKSTFGYDMVFSNNNKNKLDSVRVSYATDSRAISIQKYILDKKNIHLSLKKKDEELLQPAPNVKIDFKDIVYMYESTINKSPNVVFSDSESLMGKNVLGSAILDDLQKNVEVLEFCIYMKLKMTPRMKFIKRYYNTSYCIFYLIMKDLFYDIIKYTSRKKLNNIIDICSQERKLTNNKYSLTFLKFCTEILEPLSFKNNDEKTSVFYKIKMNFYDIICEYFNYENNKDNHDDITKDFIPKENTGVEGSLRLFNFDETSEENCIVLKKLFKEYKLYNSLTDDDIEYFEDIICSIVKNKAKKK